MQAEALKVSFWSYFRFLTSISVWYIKIVPTYLYSWQFYEVMRLCCHKERAWVFVGRQIVFAGFLTGVLAVFVLFNAGLAENDYLTAMGKPNAQKYSQLFLKMDRALFPLLVVCCLITIGFMVLTIRMAKVVASGFEEMQINRPVAAAHAVGVTSQALFLILFFWIEQAHSGWVFFVL